MKAHHALVLALLLAACTPPTVAQRAAIIRTAVDTGRAGCLAAQAEQVDLTAAQREWCAR